MRIPLATVGLLPLALLLLPVIAHGECPSGGTAKYGLYEQVRTFTEYERMSDQSEGEVNEFVARILSEGEKPYSADDIQTALEQMQNEFCVNRETTIGGCGPLYGSIHTFANRVERTRTLGRELLLIASGYEVGVDGYVGRPVDFHAKLPGITRLWAGMTDQLFTPLKKTRIRSIPLSGNLEDYICGSSAINFHIDTPEKFTWAVWRYRLGFNAVKEEPGSCSDDAGNSELGLLKKRWCDVEEGLQNYLDRLPRNLGDFDPPLTRGEVAVFPVLRFNGGKNPEEDRGGGYVAWAWAKNENGKIVRDAGLQWELPLSPLLPSLLKTPTSQDCNAEMKDEGYCKIVGEKNILPGGLYPDPPKEPGVGKGICALPFAQRGYLCRAQELENCDEEVEKDEREVALTTCKPQQYKTITDFTKSGPDICRLGWWRTPAEEPPPVKDTADEDPDLRPDECGICAVDFYCGDCPGGGYGFTFPKDENGVIKICISANAPPAIMPYFLIHEMIHAQQYCRYPIGLKPTDIADTAEKCCAYEHEAYLAGGISMANDGIFDAFPISVEDYASLGPNTSCSGFGKNICSSIEIPRAIRTSLDRKIEERAGELNPNAPSCPDLINDLDTLEPRVAAMKESLKDPCTPGCRTRYENTIGNNLCYAGQCIEQSIEESRIIPGRMAANSGDESFPWDMCAKEDPGYGKLLVIPAHSPPLFPPYNPALLIEALDTALCQINGFPARTPPVLCGFDTTRRLNTPLQDYLNTAISLGNQPIENLIPSLGLQRMTQSIATRIGTDLTARYLEWAGRSMADIARSANVLLQQISDVKFPATMCPREAASTENLCEQLKAP
ncbi:MAG: hypothetical protein PHI23_02065 [Candidatus Peribacteraceae bacterium]|nr:hypothetical protein [Candidatus Peribacteraceae bacterium]